VVVAPVHPRFSPVTSRCLAASQRRSYGLTVWQPMQAITATASEHSVVVRCLSMAGGIRQGILIPLSLQEYQKREEVLLAELVAVRRQVDTLLAQQDRLLSLIGPLPSNQTQSVAASWGGQSPAPAPRQVIPAGTSTTTTLGLSP
jgi:hypothetical protein